MTLIAAKATDRGKEAELETQTLKKHALVLKSSRWIDRRHHVVTRKLKFQGNAAISFERHDAFEAFGQAFEGDID